MFRLFSILLLLLLAPPVAFAQEKSVFSIVRIEPADRENFYLKFGYDDGLVKENQLNGDYTTTTIGGQTYYMPWLNIQQGQNASILPPPQTLTGSLGHTDVERITPEFHLGLDGTINKRWELEPGKTKAIEYDASGKKLREWKYIIENGKLIWKEQ